MHIVRMRSHISHVVLSSPSGTWADFVGEEARSGVFASQSVDDIEVGKEERLGEDGREGDPKTVGTGGISLGWNIDGS